MDVRAGGFGKYGGVEGRWTREMCVDGIVSGSLKKGACMMGRLSGGCT